MLSRIGRVRSTVRERRLGDSVACLSQYVLATLFTSTLLASSLRWLCGSDDDVNGDSVSVVVVVMLLSVAVVGRGACWYQGMLVVS